MYLPRPLLSHLYTSLLTRLHPLSPPVLLLVALTPDALCAARILTALLKRDYIPHKVQPVSGYAELAAAGRGLVCPLTRQRGGEGGVVVCLGVGGMVDLEDVLGLEEVRGQGQEGEDHGVEVWCLDGRRPWNLQNVFGGGEGVRGVERGRIERGYVPGRGGVVVFDDGDVEMELGGEREAFCELVGMPELGDGSDSEGEGEDDGDEDEDEQEPTRKRKSLGDNEDSSEDDDDERPRRRRRSNSGSAIPSSPSEDRARRETFALSNHPSSSQRQSESPVPSSPPPRQPSARAMRRKLMRLRRKHEAVLSAYYALGTSYSEPLSSLIYNLAEELGREDNDLLWLAIVGVSSLELYATAPSQSSAYLSRQNRIASVLRDEVRRLNPLPPSEITLSRTEDIIPTTARSPTDTAIRISPEPRFLLTRHWSLYESMLHSPYLSSRLHIWTDAGRKRLDRLLTKMGVSLDEARKGYTHMDMELKRTLRPRLLRFAPMYGLDGLVPPQSRSAEKEGWSFVRCWGWRACLSASDVAVIVSAILEVGADPGFALTTSSLSNAGKDAHRLVMGGYGSRMTALPTPENSPSHTAEVIADPDYTTNRFYAAFDALAPGGKGLDLLMGHIDTAKHLHAAILRTGSGLMNKGHIRHLRAFRMGVVREGPDVALFCHPGALVKLAGWVSEAVGIMEAERGAREKGALVLGALDEARGVYVVVGLGGGGSARVRSRNEQREREERRRKKKEERDARRAAEKRRREERKRRKREREEANGIFRDEGEEDDDSESSESEEESGGSDDDDGESEDEEMLAKRKRRGYGLNKFGSAFQEVVNETGARVKIDSFEHSVVEVKKEDFSGFLEALSLKSVVG
ncbi:Cell division control protein 45 [Sphaceloma murrayae]|uniref:Cell division control protein 45 n=1 Tax=Sphaceloma murrayae TaxID=2082308 RepID=A0A2K1QJP5_9PEZI|nr:Cell division control protein 45 [Sphaceloma murrayae]